MTRIAIFLVFLFALAGGLFYFWQSEKSSPESPRQSKKSSQIEEVHGETIEVRAVYATRKIKRNSVVRDDCLEERIIESNKGCKSSSTRKTI